MFFRRLPDKPSQTEDVRNCRGDAVSVWRVGETKGVSVGGSGGGGFHRQREGFPPPRPPLPAPARKSDGLLGSSPPLWAGNTSRPRFVTHVTTFAQKPRHARRVPGGPAGNVNRSGNTHADGGAECLLRPLPAEGLQPELHNIHDCLEKKPNIGE